MRAFLALALFFATAQAAPIEVVQAWLSSDEGARREDVTGTLSTLSSSSSLENHLKITSEERQVFDGIGGSFMRSGAFVLNQLPQKQQEGILHDLFDPVDGARFTVGKIPIAATDFGFPEWYTYADEEQDESLPNFSIEKDLDYNIGFVPYVKRANHKAGTALRLQATLDYYPNWMLADGAKGLPSPDLNATLMTAISNYYLKYVEAINEQGLQLEYLSLFNELTSSYMNASYDHTRTLLMDYVKPLLNKSLKRPPKLTWTEKYGRRNTVETSRRFFEMEGTNEAMEVLFYHGYDCGDHGGWQCDGLNTTCPKLQQSAEMLKVFYDQYNGEMKRPVWMTELCYASEFDDYNYRTDCPKLPRMDFTDALQWGEMLFTDFNVIESNAWIYWNMLLDMNGGPWLISPPHNDPLQNPQQALIHADLETGEYTLTGSYYAMWHFGRIPVSAVRHTITSPSDLYPTLRSVAFADKNGDGTVTVVLMNKDGDAHDVHVSVEGREGVVKVSLPAVSIMTVIVK